MRTVHRLRNVALAGAAVLGAAACGSSPAAPGSVAPTPAAGRPALPAVPPEWAAWIQANQHPIRSTSATDTDFADLQFLKQVIGGRRLVQLGESGHGVAEFDSTKVRLVQFLHEEMGFDVIAFESGLYECFRADERALELDRLALMRSCIFGVWHADETLPLFDYIKATRATARPLTLAGFDTQFSTVAGRTSRAAEVRDLLGVVDPALADRAYSLDLELGRLVGLQDSLDARTQLSGGKAETMIAGYAEIADAIDAQQPRLERAFASRPLFPRVMGRAMRMAPSLIRSLAGSTTQYGAFRDQGMADNVTWLARELHPDRKIIVWAHNYHIQHDGNELVPPAANMGSYLVARHRDELYTIGLYMYWGKAALNTGQVYDVAPPEVNSLEALLGRTTPPAAFVDLLGQGPSAGTAWMFQKITSRSWGYIDETLTHRRQYDGILFVDEVHPPHYR